MVPGNFEKELLGMFNHSRSNIEEMESQGLEAKRPPGWRQCFSLRNREDIVCKDIESPPGAIRKEPFGKQHTPRNVVDGFLAISKEPLITRV